MRRKAAETSQPLEHRNPTPIQAQFMTSMEWLSAAMPETPDSERLRIRTKDGLAFKQVIGDVSVLTLKRYVTVVDGRGVKEEEQGQVIYTRTAIEVEQELQTPGAIIEVLPSPTASMLRWVQRTAAEAHQIMNDINRQSSV